MDSDGQTVGVQCKSRSSRRIGVTDVEKFCNQLRHLNLSRGFYVSTQGFTSQALEFINSVQSITAYDWEHLKTIVARHDAFFERIDIQQLLAHGTLPRTPTPCQKRRITWTDRETEIFSYDMRTYVNHEPKPWTVILEQIRSDHPGELHEKRDTTSLKDKWREMTLRGYVIQNRTACHVP